MVRVLAATHRFGLRNLGFQVAVRYGDPLEHSGLAGGMLDALYRQAFFL